MYLARVLPVPVGDEVVELSLDDLPSDIEEYVQVLREERCSAAFWLKLASECGARKRSNDCEVVLQSAIHTLTNVPPNGVIHQRSHREIAEEVAPFHAMLATLQLAKARTLPKIVLKEAKYQNLLASTPGVEPKDRWYQAAAAHSNVVVMPSSASKAVQGGARHRSDGLQTNMLLGRGVYLSAIGKTDEALHQFDLILQKQSRNPVALLGKASCLLRKRSYVPALRIYQSVLSISIAQAAMAARESAIVGPDGELVESQASKWLGPDPRVGIGLCLHGLGRSSEAQRAWSRAIAVNPGNAAPHLLLGLSKINTAKQMTGLSAALIAEKGKTESGARAAIYKEGVAHIQAAWKLDNKNAMTAVTLAEHFCVRASATGATDRTQAQQDYERALKLAEHAIQYADSRVAVNQAWLTFARTAHLYSYLDETSTSTVELRATAQRFFSRVVDDLSKINTSVDPQTLAPGYAMAVVGLAQLQASRGEVLGAINTTEMIMSRPASVSSSCLELSLLASALRAQSHPGASEQERLSDRQRARIVLDRTLRSIEACVKLTADDNDVLDEGLAVIERITNPDEGETGASEAAGLAIARTALGRENLGMEAAREIARLGEDELNFVQMAELLRDRTSGSTELLRSANNLLLAIKAVRRRGHDVGQDALATSADVAALEKSALRLRANLGATLALKSMEEPAEEHETLSSALGQMQETLNLAGKAISGSQLDAEKTIVLFNLGRTLELLGNEEDAQKAYDAVLTTHPEYVDAKIRIAILTVCRASSRGSREATQLGNALLKEALQSDPANFDTRSTYVCFLSGALPASPNPPQWDSIKETIAQLFMGGGSAQAAQIFGSASAAKAVTDEARHDTYTLSALGWAYYNLGHNQSGPQAKKERQRALLRCCDLLDKSLAEDPSNAFALQGLAILSAEGTLAELSSPANANASAQELETRRKKGADDAINMLTKLREVSDDSGVHVCMGHAYMIKEDFERALRAYDLAARKSSVEAESTTETAAITNKPSLLQYLARASYHLGLQTKSYTLLKQSIEYFDQALIQLEQRASSGAIAEGKYVRYNIAVTHQKIMQMLFDLPVEDRQLSVLEEAVTGIGASQDTFKSLLPDAQAGKLASITGEIVEQRLLYSESSLQRASAKHIEQQRAYEERVKVEREAIAARKRERQQALDRELLEREEARRKREEAIEEERKQANEAAQAWEYIVEEEKKTGTKTKAARASSGGKRAKNGKKAARRRKMDEGGSEIESEDDDRGATPSDSDDDGMVVDDDADVGQSAVSDDEEEILGSPEDSGASASEGGRDGAANGEAAARRKARKQLKLKRAAAGKGKKLRRSAASGDKDGGDRSEKRARKSRPRVNSDEEDEEEEEARPTKKPKKSKMRRAAQEDLIESDEEV